MSDTPPALYVGWFRKTFGYAEWQRGPSHADREECRVQLMLALPGSTIGFETQVLPEGQRPWQPWEG